MIPFSKNPIGKGATLSASIGLVTDTAVLPATETRPK